MIISTLQKLKVFLRLGSKKNLIFLLVLMLIVAILDAIGLASIMPLIALILDPELLNTNAYLRPIWNIAQNNLNLGPDQFIVLFGITLFVILVLTLSLRAALTYLQLSYSSNLEHIVASWMMNRHLQLPYEATFTRNSGELGAKILTEVSTVIYQSLIPMLIILTNGFVAFAMLTILVVVNGYAAIIIGSTLAILYAFIVLATRKKVDILGQERLLFNQKRFSTFSQALRGFKDIKISKNEHVFIQQFSQASKPYAVNWAKGQIIAQLPRYLIELIAFGGMLLFLMLSFINKIDVMTSFPNITLYALICYRLLPSMQQIYSNLSNLKFAFPSLTAMHSEISFLSQVHNGHSSNEINLDKASEADRNYGIILSNVSYKYPNSHRWALHNISINIPENCSIGIIGETGSGKSSLVDIVMGLLVPTHGSVLIDEQSNNLQALNGVRHNIGYVPQDIYIFDASIAENIALGETYNQINWERLKQAVNLANLTILIEKKLKNGYNTHLGEDAIKLSGGEKQRIGIARALYRNPTILIFDEATSALDIKTEAEVLSSLKIISKKLTLIMIAHRLDTVKDCDRIYLLEEGVLKAEGAFDDVIEHLNNNN